MVPKVRVSRPSGVITHAVTDFLWISRPQQRSYSLRMVASCQKACAPAGGRPRRGQSFPGVLALSVRQRSVVPMGR